MSWNKNPYKNPQTLYLYWEKKIFSIVDKILLDKKQPTLRETMAVWEYSVKSEIYRQELQNIKLKFKLKARKKSLAYYLRAFV